MADELKPCPFCGHPKSRLLFKREYCENAEGFVAVRYRIWRACNKCWARAATSGRRCASIHTRYNG